MEPFEIKGDHSKEGVNEAIGLTDARATELATAMREIVKRVSKGSGSTSEAMEEMSKLPTTGAEAAYVFTKFGEYTQ